MFSRSEDAEAIPIGAGTVLDSIREGSHNMQGISTEDLSSMADENLMAAIRAVETFAIADARHEAQKKKRENTVRARPALLN